MNEVTITHKYSAIVGYFRMGATVDFVFNLSWVTNEFTLQQIQTLHDNYSIKIN